MQVVINIDDEIYERLRNSEVLVSGLRSGKRFLSKVLIAVANGVELPKGHGRLGDLDELEKDMKNYIIFNVHDCVELVNCADTIIKADNGKENRK